MTLSTKPHVRTIAVNGRLIETDTEGYLINLDDW